MYNVGIDVHKTKCVIAIKDKSPEVLKRTSFNNNVLGIGFLLQERGMNLIDQI